jgi:hypothetical protein
MKSVVVGLVVVVLAAAAIALQGAAAGTTGAAADPKVAALEKRIAKLEARVKKVESFNKDTTLVEVGTLAAIACEAAMTADTFQTTWGVVDQIAQTAQGKVYFGPQAALNDQQSCADLALLRQAPGTPPTLVPLSKVIDFVYGP